MFKRRVKVKVLGRIDAQALYTTEGCLRYGGIGRTTLSEACRAGIVTPLHCGRRVYFSGEDLIRMIRTEAEKRNGS